MECSRGRRHMAGIHMRRRKVEWYLLGRVLRVDTAIPIRLVKQEGGNCVLKVEVKEK